MKHLTIESFINSLPEEDIVHKNLVFLKRLVRFHCPPCGRKHLWTILAKALGEKAHPNDQLADQIAYLRLLFFMSYMITNCFIIAGVIKHWND